ncbi:MAG: aspartyl/asparaginyl beta-hydroxylase domain-containing protein [Hyphomonadaceae bacterium]
MKLETPVRALGPVGHEPLKAAVEAVRPEVWSEDQLRQMAFEQHAATQSIILLFAEGWPNVKVSRRKGWEYFAAPAGELMKEVVAKYYGGGGAVIRALVAKLTAGAEIADHFDGHGTFDISHRIHVPLVTNDQVEFRVRGEAHNMKEGLAYEISNTDIHGVSNRSDVDRIHFIFDYMPPR